MRVTPRIAALLAALSLVACGGASGDPAASGPDPSAEPSDAAPADTQSPAQRATPPATGEADRTSPPDGVAAAAVEALDFTAPALSGGQVEGATYAGGDVVLWMWAPW